MISEHEQAALAAKRLRNRKKGGKHSTRELAHLGEKQIRFIDEYMIDRDGAAAAIRAGYTKNSAKRSAYRLRSHPAIAAEIERRTHERARRCDVQTDDVLRELKRIAFFDVRKLFDPATGKFYTNPYEMDEEEARGLVNYDVVVLDKEGDFITKLNPGNKLKALELLMRHAGMLTDKREVDAKHTVIFSLDVGEEKVAVPDQ